MEALQNLSALINTNKNRLSPLASFFVLLYIAIALFVTVPAMAHFLLNVNIRTIHVLHEDNQLRLLVRLPMSYLVADKLGPVDEDGVPKPAPYTTNQFEDENLVHYIDPNAIRNNPSGLGKILANGIILNVGGNALNPQIGRIRAYPSSEQPPFAHKSEAEQALNGPVYDQNFSISYVGDIIIDAELIYNTNGTVTNYELQSLLNPNLPEQDDTANLIIDHSSDEPLIFRIRGLLNEPVEIGQSAIAAFLSFTIEGARHVLEGLDHVLFIFCLVLAAATLKNLAWLITGFTIGHTITLSMGFFNYVPNAPWFIPLVETGIAISIVYAGMNVIFHQYQRSSIAVTSLIGLLHGLGFSFVLREILKIEGPNVWQSLLAFNIGIEIGQLAFATLVWMLLSIYSKKYLDRLQKTKTILSVPCILLASYWIGERSIQFFSHL